MQSLVPAPLMAHPKDFVLWRSGRVYYAAGHRVFSITGGCNERRPNLQVHDEDLLKLLRGQRVGRRPHWLSRDTSDTQSRLLDANIVRLVGLQEEAVRFLQEARADHPEWPVVVSWSGGKDSTVASVLAQRAFSSERIVHAFADTTIELPSTYEYIAQFRQGNPAVPFFVGIPARDFFDLCREIGPPSRIQRWCCTTHKAAPLTDLLRAIGGDTQVFTVGGLRRTESARRQSYSRIIDEGKIGLQVLLNPIVDWTDFDVWLWIMLNHVSINTAYYSGLDRVGCAFCPDAGIWSNMIGEQLFPDYYHSWFDLLVETAEQAGMEAPGEWVSSGAWRDRRGGGIGATGLPGTEKYDIVTMPCDSDEYAVTYEMSTDFSLKTLAELLKPFGAVSCDLNSDDIGYYHVLGPHGAFAAKAIPHWRRVRVTFDSLKTKRSLEGTVRLQLRKLQACAGCGACAAICPEGAIIKVGSDYSICEERCSHCLRCIRGLRAGCRAADSLHSRQVVRHG